MKRGMALERAHVRRKQAEADRAAAVAVVDAVDQRRQLLALIVVGSCVTVTLEIEAAIETGAPENVVRTVTENSRTLKFGNS